MFSNFFDGNMGRELNRKKNKNQVVSKKDDKKVKTVKVINNDESSDNEQVSKLIKMIIIVAGIILVVYLFIGVFITKEIDIKKWFNNNKETNQEVAFDYKEILIGETFTKNKSEYYVLYYDFKGYDSNLLNYVVEQNLQKKDYYIANTNNMLNQKYVVKETGNNGATNIEQLKVSDPTLILIKNGVISTYIEGVDNIVSHLKDINK